MKLSEVAGHKFNAPDAAELFDIIKKHCGQWIAETNWLPVYRGSKMIGEYDDFVKIKTRPNKQDPDVPDGIQAKFDQLLKNKGHTALLRNSIHIIGDLGEAKTYGRPFVIFPIGDFSISWSPNVISVMGSLFRDGKQIAKVEDIIPNYRDSNLVGAIRSGNEILVQCDEYYKVDLGLWNEISS